MKRVFSSHSQCAHVWAQQTQKTGKAGNVFFEGDTIYSYGYHYKAARILSFKGKKFALLRSDPYSISTTKHLYEIADSLRGLMPCFRSGDVNDWKVAIKEADASAHDSVKRALKRIKVESKESIRWEVDSVLKEYLSATKVREFFGRAPLRPKAKDLIAIREHLEFRLKRFKELNTPEQIERRAKDAVKRAAKKAEAEVRKHQEQIEKFRRGEYANLYSLPYELLRIKNDIVETSRGASVPLREALALFRAIRSGKASPGIRVGSFTFNAIEERETDSVVRIGCHRILLSEAEQVLGKFALTVVKGGAA